MFLVNSKPRGIIKFKDFDFNGWGIGGAGGSLYRFMSGVYALLQGKEHLNFSGWNEYSAKRKDHKLDELIEEVGEDNANDEWREEFTQWDVSGSYDFSKGFSLFLEFSNIGNRPRYNYIGIPSRAREHSVNGISFNTGLRWSL